MLPRTINLGFDCRNCWVIENIEYLVTTLYFVMDTRFEVFDTHLSQIAHRWELFGFKICVHFSLLLLIN
jgi:hypothetical protein